MSQSENTKVKLLSKSKGHIVRNLGADKILKISSGPEFNEVMHEEYEMMKKLKSIHGELIPDIIDDGYFLDGFYYVLARVYDSTLSEILFSEFFDLITVQSEIESSAGQIVSAIMEERKDGYLSGNTYHELLEKEWQNLHDIPEMCELVNYKFKIDGEAIDFSLANLFHDIYSLSANKKIFVSPVAHLNFHFGNVFYCVKKKQVLFIDPDVSLPKMDPLFGLARFAFSFWHEVATERTVNFSRSKQGEHTCINIDEERCRSIFQNIPEMSQVTAYRKYIDDEIFDIFTILLAYCFVRSLNLNLRREHVVSANKLDGFANVAEKLIVGCLSFFREEY